VPDVNLGQIDLNLLVALDALLAEQSTTKAGARLGLTQPAVSRALGRLRVLFDDPLLVRGPRGLVPTERAAALAEPVRRVLAEVARVIGNAPRFEPASARRTFRIGMIDYAEMLLLPALAARLAREAPSVDVGVRPLYAGAYEALEEGRLDAAVGVFVDTPPAGIKRRKLFDERFVCLLRRGHPALARPLDLGAFVSLAHAVVAPRGLKDGGFVDDALARLGQRRRVALRFPHFLVAPHVIASSDLVVTIAERIARRFADLLPLSVVEPPLAIDRFSVHLLWHERHDADPGNAWLRSLLAELGASV
jgi:DNA-binding transcriptional LysR family regulator